MSAPDWPIRASVYDDAEDRIDVVLTYVMKGIIIVTIVPFVVITAPIWIPLAVLGWLVSRVKR